MSETHDRGVFVGVELGGTKIVIATGRGGRTFERRSEVPTLDPISTLHDVRSAIRELADGQAIVGLGIASFGPIDLRWSSNTYGTLLSTPKTGWTGVNVVQSICRDIDAPIGVDTDVNGAVLAEKHWGAGGDHDHVAYLTVGTGVGGGVWANGRVVHGANHPEIGHIRVPRHKDDHHISSCPFHEDCLEGMASGTAVRERWGAPAQDLGRLTASATRLEAWYLARGIAGLCAIIPVELVIVGGGVAKLPGLHAEITQALDEASGAYPPVPFAEGGPLIVAPGLGDDAGVLGAIELARIAAEGSVTTPA